MAKKRLTFFKWFPADALADEHYAQMTFEERGFYHTLLNLSWINDGLPVELERLDRMIGVPMSYFLKLWETVGPRWTVVEGRFRNPRQEEERADVNRLHIAKSRPGNQNARKSFKNAKRTQKNATAKHTKTRPSVSVSSSSSSSSDSGSNSSDTENPTLSEKTKIHKTFVSEVLEPDRFEEFWSAYWLKRAKQDAEKAFQKHVRTSERFDLVMRAVYAQTPEMLSREPRNRPHAATWLNGARWNDEEAPLFQARPAGRPGFVENVTNAMAKRVAEGKPPL